MEYITGTLELDDNLAAREVWTLLSEWLAPYDGQLGYRQPSVGIRQKEDIPTIILISSAFGIVLIDVVDDQVVEWDESREYLRTRAGEFIYSRDIVIDNFRREIELRLAQDTVLYERARQRLRVQIHSLLVFTRNTAAQIQRLDPDSEFVNTWIARPAYRERLRELLNEWRVDPSIPAEFIDRCISRLEGTAVLGQRARRPAPVALTTRNDFIQRSLEQTFKLDEVQRRIAIQVSDGPQRIRGLAGTGKIVILSLKAALAHKDFPQFKILFLFNTRSMYSQIRGLIETYFISETKQAPNWSNLQVYHAWGGRAEAGLYYETCRKYGVRPLTYRELSGFGNPLERLYELLLQEVRQKLTPEYDLVLIDEAQDFTASIFETVYHLTKAPKRIIWAYDEFQSLTDIRMPEPEALFGTDADGKPNLPSDVLGGTYAGGIEKDFILPNSYRNPRITLLTAHGLALGIYRSQGIVEVMDTRRDWEALGYRVLEPADKESYDTGDDIVIERPTEYSRNILERLLSDNGQNERELLTFTSFAQKTEEIVETAEEIARLISDEDVKPEDIFVITLDVRNSKADLSALRSMLDERNVKSIMPGFFESASLFKVDGFVTLCTPFRAKGNEANVVFVLGAQVVPGDPTFRKRNAVFVGVTRSRGWTYISGSGPSLDGIGDEIDHIVADYPNLRFRYPEQDELARRRVILARDEQSLERQQMILEDLIAQNPELLIERIKADPALARKIAGKSDTNR